MGRCVCALAVAASLVLAACGPLEPSDETAAELIYALELRDVELVGKSRCETLPRMEAQGHTNVWLVEYRLAAREEVLSLLLSRVDGDWRIYRAADQCPR